jgi:hypothetical protein
MPTSRALSEATGVPEEDLVQPAVAGIIDWLGPGR